MSRFQMYIDNSVSSETCCQDFKFALTTPYPMVHDVKNSNVH